MDENKNQNDDFGFDNENNETDLNDYSGSQPAWMGTSSDLDEDEDEMDEEDSLGHESLLDDQEIDIDEYDEADKNPVEEEEAVFDNDKTEDDDQEPSIYEEDEEEDEEEKNDNVVLPKSKIILAKKLLDNIKENNNKLYELLGGLITDEDESRISISELSEGLINGQTDDDVSKIIEGVFDGENMIGPDGKQYNVPSNYASKSKLVEGDLLKLTITHKGTFVYKQIKPVERERVIGTLEKYPDGSHVVSSGNKRWRVITASVTYFKGEPGDESVILVPKGAESKWAAVENIIRNK